MSVTQNSSGGTSGDLSALLTSLQQGVVAVNQIVQTMASIFPST